MSDVPSPFKKELPEYNEREERMLSMIYEKFLGSDLTPEEKMQLNAIDKAMLWYDLTFLLGGMRSEHLARWKKNTGGFLKNSL